MKAKILAAVLVPWAAGLAADNKMPSKDPSPTMKMVSYHDADIVPIAVQLHYATLVEIQGDEVITIALGDTDHWDENHHANTVFVLPKKTGVKTDLIVIGKKRAYTFTLTEISDTPGAVADLKVFVKPSDSLRIQQFASIEDLEAERRKVKAAQDALEAFQKQQKVERNVATESAREAVESKIQHVYTWHSSNKAARDAFDVASIYNLDGWTVIEGRFQETPTIYEVKDGKDSLVEFEMKDNKYIVKKVLGRGYMRVGKALLTFERES